MPVRVLGDRPTTAERMRRLCDRQRQQAALAQEAVAFVLALRPRLRPRSALAALQRRLREPHTQVDPP